MPAPFRIPDFSEPPPGTQPARVIPSVTADEALDAIRKMLDAFTAYPKTPDALSMALAHGRTTLARAGRPYVSAASRRTQLDAGVATLSGA